MILGLIGAILSVVSTLHSRRKAKKQQARLDAEMDKQKGFDVPVDGEAINLPLVYGYAKIGGVRSVVHTADNGAIVAPPSGFEDRSVNLGVGNHDGSKKEYMVVQQAFCYGDIDEFLDFEVDGQNYDYHKFSHHIRLSKSGGVADPTAVAFNVPLGNTNKFTGMAWASQVYKLNRDDPEYSGTPNLTAYIRGTRVRDIFNDNGEWKFSNEYTFSNNSAVVIADYLTRPIEKGGRGLPDNKVDLASFGHAKAICDTIVASNVDVRGRVNGVRPVQDGQVEPLPAKRELKLYECNLVIDTSSPSRDIIEQLLETMAQAKLVYSNGIYKLKLDYPASDVEQDNLITATYSDSDILGKIEVAVAGASERFNRCEVKFKNESMDYANDSVSWPVRGSAAHVQYLAEDNGKPNETTYTLFGGTHRQSALAKAEEIVRESRIGKTIKFKIDRKALVHEISDIFKLNSVASKITNELFKITGIRIDSELNATIQAERFDWNSLSWNVEDSYVEPAIVIPGTVVPNVSNLTWTDGSRIGDNKNNGYLTWTAPETTSVRRYHIWAKRPSVGDWVKISETVEDHFDIPADFNTEGHDYQFLVKTENSRGYISQGAMVLADQMPNLVPVSGVTKEVGMNTVKLAWSNAVPQLVGAYKVYVGTSNVRGDAILYGTTASTEMVISPLAVSSYYFWIDAIGMDGSIAAGSSTVVSALELGIKSGDISANTITWSHLANNVQSDMEGYVSSANAHAQAANTSAQAAQVHANSANTAKTTAQNAASSANNSASAASTSASQASISANNSAQSAAASANSALTANTHAGTAKSYRDQAAVSKNDAAGSATAAATSAGVAVDAQNDVISLNGNPYFKYNKEGWKPYNSANTAAFNAMTVVSGPTAGKALQHTSPEQVRFLSDATIPVDTDRSYRLTMRAKAVGGLSRVYAGAHFYNESGSIIGTRYFGANSRNIYAVDGWTTLRGVVSGIGSAQSNFPDGTSYIRTLVILQYTNSTATSALIDALLFEDVTESKSAEASASAASTSASSAAASANNSAQSASAAASSENSAETARSAAETYRNEAALSSTTAAEHSRLNMVGRSTFAPGEVAPWEDKYSVVSVSGHPNGQTHALRQTDRDLYTVASIVEQINNRVFRISGVVDNSNNPFEARAGIRIVKSDGNYHWPTAHIASANEGVKRFDVTLTISNSAYANNQSFRFFLQSNGPSGTANGHRIDWSEVRYEDITESDKAAQSVSAAAIVEGVVTKTLGSENFSNPVFKDWNNSINMPEGFGDVQINANNRYFSRVPGKYYDAVQFTVLDKNSGSANRPFCRIDSKYHNELELPSANSLEAVRVTLEVEKISGDWGGACSRVSWIRADAGGTNAHQYYYFDDNLSDENGVIQTVEFEMTKPDGFNPGTNPNGSYLALYFFGTSEYGGRVNQNVKWKLHRASIRQITKGASTQISQKAVSDLEGNQSAAIVMRASTSNSALLELSSLKDAETGGSVTAARISAASILLDGSVSARKMDVDGLLQISDHGALSIGKESASDYANSGIFFGRDGSNTGFGFFAGRRDGNDEQYIRVVKDSFTIRNAQFEIASDTASTSSYNQSGTYALASGVATIAALTLVGGGGGGGAAASDSQNGNSGQSGYPTIVELIDKDNNVIQTWTQNGGAGGPGGRSSSFGDPNNQSEGPWLWSQKSPYGNGGRGATGGNRESGEAGRASPILNVSNIDVSGVDEPKLRITIGAGGLGGHSTSSSRVGSPGNAGLVEVSAEGAGVIPAGVLAQEPAVSGTMAVVTGDNNNFNRFPDLGPGMWAVQGGYWKIVDGHSIHPDIHTFVARTRPGVTYSGGGGHHTLNYYFWPLK